MFYRIGSDMTATVALLFVICAALSTAAASDSLALQEHQRLKRQFGFDFNTFPPFSARQQQQRQRHRLQQQPGAALIFSNSGGRQQQQQQPQQQPPASTSTSTSTPAQVVFINNQPTIATMAPFVQRPTPSAAYLSCFNSCPTTSEYNPICGSDQQRYFNEQKFNCALRCGADIQIVRRGSCEGLFQMMRG